MTRRRWWLIGSIAALVLAAVAGIWIWQTVSRPATAEETTMNFLRALESGDAAAVDATGIDVSTRALTVFSGASGFIEDARVSAIDENRDGGEATASVAFQLGGKEHRAELTLTRADEVWTVDATALGAMTATATAGSFIDIGDESVPVGEEVQLLPAAYTIAAAPASLLQGETTLIVLPRESSEAAVDVTLRDDATEAAQEQLDAHLDSCTIAAAAMPAGCGIRIPWGTEFRSVADIRYRIEQRPEIVLTPTTFSTDDGVLVATVTGTGQDGAERTATYRTDSWNLRGDISFSADKVVLSIW